MSLFKLFNLHMKKHVCVQESNLQLILGNAWNKGSESATHAIISTLVIFTWLGIQTSSGLKRPVAPAEV